MTNDFVRKETGILTKIDKVPLYTNKQLDLLLTKKDQAYIRLLNSYHCLTDNIKSINGLVPDNKNNLNIPIINSFDYYKSQTGKDTACVYFNINTNQKLTITYPALISGKIGQRTTLIKQGENVLYDLLFTNNYAKIKLTVDNLVAEYYLFDMDTLVKKVEKNITDIIEINKILDLFGEEINKMKISINENTRDLEELIPVVEKNKTDILNNSELIEINKDNIKLNQTQIDTNTSEITDILGLIQKLSERITVLESK